MEKRAQYTKTQPVRPNEMSEGAGQPRLGRRPDGAILKVSMALDGLDAIAVRRQTPRPRRNPFAFTGSGMVEWRHAI